MLFFVTFIGFAVFMTLMAVGLLVGLGLPTGCGGASCACRLTEPEQGGACLPERGPR